jgi:Fe-S cluster biogenesis protein NfuA
MELAVGSQESGVGSHEPRVGSWESGGTSSRAPAVGQVASSWIIFDSRLPTPDYIPTMDTIDRIERTLDTLRPYIASHRGRVEVVDFDEQDGILLLRLGGSCHGCSASTVTLKQGIESRLRAMVPEVKQVQAV